MRALKFLCICLLLAGLTSVATGAGNRIDLNVKNDPPGYRHVPAGTINICPCDTIVIFNKTTNPATTINACIRDKAGVVQECRNINAGDSTKFHWVEAYKGGKICSEAVGLKILAATCTDTYCPEGPTLTQWGLIILVALIIITGVYLWLRKRPVLA